MITMTTAMMITATAHPPPFGHPLQRGNPDLIPPLKGDVPLPLPLSLLHLHLCFAFSYFSFLKIIAVLVLSDRSTIHCARTAGDKFPASSLNLNNTCFNSP